VGFCGQGDAGGRLTMKEKMAVASLHGQLARSTGKQSGAGQNDAWEDRVVHDTFYRAKAR
jgi:hypothetical protein